MTVQRVIVHDVKRFRRITRGFARAVALGILWMGFKLPFVFAEGAPSVGIVDQLVSSEFIPQSTFTLAEVSPGIIQKYPGAFVVRGDNKGGQSESRLLLGAVIPLISSGERQSVTFFLKGRDTAFSATPIKTWRVDEIVKNTMDISEVKSEAQKVKQSVVENDYQLEQIEGELKTLRRRASQIAGVDEIIDLKMDLARVRGFGEQTVAEQQRLKRLIDVGQRWTDPTDINNYRQELTVQLKDTAQRTAMASRLSARKREAAKMSLDQKLALVKEMSAYDPTVLAQELLKIRAQRKELETKLQGAAPADDEF